MTFIRLLDYSLIRLLYSQFSSPRGFTAFEHFPAVCRSHPASKTMFTDAFFLFWLIGSFWHCSAKYTLKSVIVSKTSEVSRRNFLFTRRSPALRGT